MRNIIMPVCSELADGSDLGSDVERRTGSSPVTGTRKSVNWDVGIALYGILVKTCEK